MCSKKNRNENQQFHHTINISLQNSCFKFYFSVKCYQFSGYVLVVIGLHLASHTTVKQGRYRNDSQTSTSPGSRIARTSGGFLKSLFHRYFRVPANTPAQDEASWQKHFLCYCICRQYFLTLRLDSLQALCFRFHRNT